MRINDVTCECCANELIINVMIGSKPCRFLLDTGATISIIKKGISQKIIRSSDVVARCVTGSKIKIYGRQKVSLSLGNTRIDHDFVVADILTPYDGLMGLDLMKRIGLKIDFTTGNIFIGDNDHVVSTIQELGSKSQNTEGEMQGPHPSFVSERAIPTLRDTNDAY